VIKATEAGVYRLGVSGLGRFRLLADGAEVFDETLSPRPGADIAETLMAPPQRLASVSLAAGQSVAIRLEHDVHSSPLAGFGTFLQLNLEAPHGTDDEEIAAAVALATGCDVAVVVVGTTAQVESEGFDRPSLALPGRQDELVRRVAAACPRTVVVVNSGAPVLMPWADEVAAVLLTWFGGQEFGNALADVLLGDAEPGGRLPTTWPAAEEGLPSAQPADGVLPYTEGLFVGYPYRGRRGPHLETTSMSHRCCWGDIDGPSMLFPAGVGAGEGRAGGADEVREAGWASGTGGGRPDASGVRPEASGACPEAQLPHRTATGRSKNTHDDVIVSRNGRAAGERPNRAAVRRRRTATADRSRSGAADTACHPRGSCGCRCR
jgi:beta-glucosidase